MNDTVYRVDFSRTAEIWLQKNGYYTSLQSLPVTVLMQLQKQDLLEVEIAPGETAIFSVIRKTVKLSVAGQVTIKILLDHPVR
jgi:hypothetical protein